MESKVFPKGYTIGYGYDEESGKYYLINQETNEATRPFVDEVLFSEAPLETWTANYVVVRIGEHYYIADSEGNCYFEESTPFIICRNVFVQGEKKYIVDKSMQKRTYEYAIDILESAKYRYATLKCDTDVYRIIKATGGYTIYSMTINSSCVHHLDNWYIYTEGSVYILDEEFNIIYERNRIGNFSMRGKNSRTYEYNSYYPHHDIKYFSSFFNSEISSIDVFGELEVVYFDGKIYFFKPNGETECIENQISQIRVVDDFIVYRQGMNIVVRDVKTGQVIEIQKLSVNEFYRALMDEKMIKQQSELLECQKESIKHQKEVIEKLKRLQNRFI